MTSKPYRRLVSSPSAAKTHDPHAPSASSGWIASVEDRDSIVELIGALIRHGVRGVVRKGHARFPIRPVGIKEDVIRWEVPSAILTAPFEVELEGYNSVFYLPISQAVQRGHTVTTEVPAAVRQARRRWYRRAEPASPLPVTIHDAGSGAELCGEAHNLSYGGLLVRLAKDQPLLPGQSLPHVLIHRDGRESVPLACEVRFARESGDGFMVGLKVVAAMTPAQWQECVDDHLHPRTRAGGPCAEAQWRLFDRCGYFRLSGKAPEDFMRLRRAYVSVTRQLHEHPHLASQVVWGPPESEEVVAAATAVKVYQGAWLGIQMAKDSGDAPDGTPGRQVLRELNYRVYEHVQQDPDLTWFFTCIQAKRVWTRYVFHDYPLSLVDSGDAAVVRFRALEVDVNQFWGDVGGSDREIDLASSEELDALCNHIAQTRPVAYAESLDLVRERIEMTQSKSLWRRSRLERDRVVLVARENGEAKAAAVVEMAAEGVHLFSLLDLARLYSLAPGGEAHYADLLEAAKGWFRSYDKDKFVCYLEGEGPATEPLRERTVDLGEADMCILAARRIPELLENIHKVAAPKAEAPCTRSRALADPSS